MDFSEFVDSNATNTTISKLYSAADETMLISNIINNPIHIWMVTLCFIVLYFITTLYFCIKVHKIEQHPRCYYDNPTSSVKNNFYFFLVSHILYTSSSSFFENNAQNHQAVLKIHHMPHLQLQLNKIEANVQNLHDRDFQLFQRQ